jgi:hypothetical protein
MGGFDEFWAAYPRRREKISARTAYDRALKRGTHEEIMAGVRQYAKERFGQEERYTKHPATWLNAGCWMDYESVAVAPIPAGAARYFKCPECFRVTIGTNNACAYCENGAAWQKPMCG